MTVPVTKAINYQRTHIQYSHSLRWLSPIQDYRFPIRNGRLSLANICFKFLINFSVFTHQKSRVTPRPLGKHRHYHYQQQQLMMVI